MKKIFISGLVLLLSSSIVYAAWMAFLKSPGNILGAKSVKMEYSADGTTWVDVMPQLINSPEMILGASTTSEAWIKTSNPADNLSIKAQDVVLTQGTGSGADTTHDITKFFKLTALNYSTSGDMMAYAVDTDSDGIVTLADFSGSGQTIGYHNGEKLTATFQLMEEAGNFDDLNGDSLTFDLKFDAI